MSSTAIETPLAKKRPKSSYNYKLEFGDTKSDLVKIDETKEQKNVNVPVTTEEKKEKEADKLAPLLPSKYNINMNMSSRLPSHESRVVYDDWRSVTKMKICDPLVVILGIGEYHDESQNLIGIGTDYKRCVHAFNNRYNYSVFYQNRKNEKIYSTTKMNLETAKLSRSVKIEWTYEEIIEFFQNARNIVVNNKHDSLIIIISSHGESDGVIIDSNHDEMPLREIYHLFTRGECDYLKAKPKIVFVDACRGKMLSNVKYQDTSKQQDTGDHKNKNNQIKTKNVSSTITTANANNNSDELPESDNGSNSNNDDDNNDNNHNNGSKENAIEKQLNAYDKESNYRFIYATSDRDAVVESSKRGGHFMRSICSVFAHVDGVVSSDLDTIVYQINYQAKKRGETSHVVQQVEDVNRMDCRVTFQQKEITL